MSSDRFRLTRGGILNVWQYDNQVFDFGGGRLLLRGTNGAGKSKTLEMLLPFVIDGDKSRITASGRHHTSLLWLMLDGYAGQSRTGYLWLEFQRTTESGATETVTCGIGLRASESARAATTWFFTSPRRVGIDLDLTDAAGPLTMQRLRAEVEPDGHFFDSNATRRYREHVGQLLFGLPLDQYEDLLRLLYWLRQPQVGEDIDPRRLAEQLVQALPQLDESAIRTAGDTFDQLEDFGEQIDRQERSAAAISDFLETYRSHARGVIEDRAATVIETEAQERRCRREVGRTERSRADAALRLQEARGRHRDADTAHTEAVARIGQLMAGPEARAQQRLLELDAHQRTKQRMADQARVRHEGQQSRYEHERSLAQERAVSLRQGATGWVEAARHTRSLGSDAGLTGLLPRTAQVVVVECDWRHEGSSQGLRGDVDASVGEVGDVRDRVGVARAAVKVVEQARVEALDQHTEAERREEASAAKEAAVSRRQARLDETTTRAAELGEGLEVALQGWRAQPAAVAFDLPELSLEKLTSLERRVAEAVAPVRGDMERRRAEAAAAQLAAERHLEAARAERATVAAETDPSPAAPTWHRDERRDRAGEPLWRLLDFHDHLDHATRSAIESALEGSGLLDAWVTPGGHFLGGTDDLFAVRQDVQVQTGRVQTDSAGRHTGGSGGVPERHLGGVPERHLGEVLRPDLPQGSLVSVAVVTGLLERVALCDTLIGLGDEAGDRIAAGHRPTGVDQPDAAPSEATPTEADASEAGPSSDATFKATPAEADASEAGHFDRGLTIALDGGWRTGAVVGRTSKAAAQYIGATARAEERLRRLAALDAAIADHEGDRVRAEAQVAAQAELLARLDEWHRSRPSHDALLQAWAAEHEAGLALEEAHAEHAVATRAAQAARSAASAAHRALVSLGQIHALPVSAEGLQAREAVLIDLLTAVRELEVGRVTLLRDLAEWDKQAERARSELSVLEDTSAESERAAADAQQAGAELEELRRAAGASVAALERRLVDLEAQRDRAAGERDTESAQIESLLGEVATLSAGLASAQLRLAETTPLLDAARVALTGLEQAPGLITAALGADGRHGGEASSAAYDRWTPLDPKQLVAALPGGRRADDTAVVAASQALISSAAANLEPRITKVEGAWVALGLGDGGELPLVDLEAQLVATVEANKLLLSERERTIFEEQVLGYLGDSLRGVRLKAAELVTAMNTQLDGVTTSQGIRVRLRWRLRDDIPADAKRAVELLGQPVGALLPSERGELRESLHRLIQASRDEAPEESYADHLSRALDYRRWFGFSVQYHRPETGEWRDLQRKSALSQGEQKVLCYLPLFAAAAAHFTSVAGAAPHAPRFVLLDDAFPKIDARTHPLLFGLLVDLDLDFVVTSERLWGTHATVPELAIYEALRSPGERGIAQFEHRWDGQQLTAVGAALGGSGA